MLLALTENDQHLLASAVVALLTALTTLAGVVATFLVITRQQTKRLVGDPKRGQPTADNLSLATIDAAVAGVVGQVKEVDRKVNNVHTELRIHTEEDDRRFEELDKRKQDRPHPGKPRTA